VTYVTTNTIVNVYSNVVTSVAETANSLAFASWIAYNGGAGYTTYQNYSGTFGDAHYNQKGFFETETKWGFADFGNQSTLNQLGLQSEASVYMSNTSGPVTCYFHFIQCPAIRVYQSLVPLDNPTLRLTPGRNQSGFQYTNPSSLYRLVANTTSAVPMTQADVNHLKSDPNALLFWNIATSQGWTSKLGEEHWSRNPAWATQLTGYKALVNQLIRYGGEWVGGAGKFTFTHDPQYGRYYYFDVSLDAGPQIKRTWIQYFAMIEYPNDIKYTTKTETVVTQVVNTVVTPVVTTVTEREDKIIIDPCGETGTPGAYTGIASASYGSGSIAVPDGTTRFDTVILHATGLLPLTEHTLYVNGTEVSTNVRPGYGEFGDPLISDPTGGIVIEYYLPMTNWAERTSELGLSKTTEGSSLILNEGNYNFISGFQTKDYLLFEILAPNSRAGTKIPYIPWTSYT
jgi:hypothetical protein